MAKIILKGNQSIEVSVESAAVIESAWRRGDRKIQVGDQTVKSGDIQRVLMQSRLVKTKYDLGDATDREMIREFEMMLAELPPAPSEPSWYGWPITNSDKVVNEIIGVSRPNIIQYCIDHFIIHKMVNGKWAVTDTKPGKENDVSRYEEFIAKWKALADLNAKRSYAESKQSAEVDALMDAAHDSLGEMPSEEEIDAALNL